MKARESSPAASPPKHANIDVQKEQNYLVDIVIVRVIFALTLTIAAYVIEPFRLSGGSTIGLGLLYALCILFFLNLLERANPQPPIGAALLAVFGIVAAV